MLNEKYRFRQNPILTLFENISQFGSSFTLPYYQALLTKVNEIISRKSAKLESEVEGSEEVRKI